VSLNTVAKKLYLLGTRMLNFSSSMHVNALSSLITVGVSKREGCKSSLQSPVLRSYSHFLLCTWKLGPTFSVYEFLYLTWIHS
jgi:hypothetical protein